MEQNRSGPTSIFQVDFNDDEQIVSFVKNRWTKRSQHRAGLERQWYVNIAQYLGYQYHFYNEATGKMILPDAPPWRVRLVCNRLMPIVRKVVSKLLRARPTWAVIPATSDLEDQMIALVGSKVLQYYWRFADMDAHIVDAATWMSTTGNVFLRVCWDKARGTELGFNEGDVSFLPPRERKSAMAGLNIGDLHFEVCSPLAVDPDPDCMKLDEASHLIDSRARNLQYVIDRFGKVAEGLTPDAASDDTLSRYYERRIQALVGTGGNASTNEDEQEHSIMVHSLWVKPCKRYEEGIYAVVAGDRVLYKGPIPGKLDCIPYVHLQEIPVPGRFWGTCALEQCLPLQASYNRGRSQLVENRNLMARPKWLCPKGSGVPENQLTSEPGEVVYYVPGLKPEAWLPPPIPDYVIRLLEYDLKDIEDVSAIHEVTQARAPSGVRSGVAIAQLQEQDDQMLAPTFLTFERALGKLGAISLKLLARNVDEKRLIRIAGKDRQIESMTFTGTDLLGNKTDPGVNYFDVECQMGSQLPLSKQARQQFVLELVNNGILDRVADRKKIFQLLDLGTEEPILTEDNLDRAAARRENLQMFRDPVLVEPMPWDNDEIHLEEHIRFQKQPEFMAHATPDVIARFEQHKQMHALRVQAMAGPPQVAVPEGGPGMEQMPPDGMPPEMPPEEAPPPDEMAMAGAGNEGMEVY